jgi:hypothetical protein
MLLVAGVHLGIAATAQAQVTTYTNESDYLTALTNLGYNTFQEGFEDDPTWGGVRTPNTAAGITSMGINWTSNHPDAVSQPSHITTGSGPARTGMWGFYSLPHGDPDASGSEAECDVETPPPTCLKHDGFMGTNTPGADTLFGVGGWINGLSGGDIILILNGDEANPVDFGDLGVISAIHKFFGVIDTRGFTQFEFRETEGKIGDEKFIFADDFTFGVNPSIFYVSALNGNDQSGDGSISDPWQTINYALSQIVAVAAPNTVRITADTYTENVLVDKNGAVINLIGGCNESFLTCNTQTTIKGTLEIADATIVVENIVLEP